jgi:hypothetical protein
MIKSKMINRLTINNTLIVEFSSLLILIGSLFWLGRVSTQGTEITWPHLLIPIVASAMTLAAFVGNLYVKWLNAAKGKTERHHKLLFALFCVFLLAIWVIAVIQTLHSL